MVKKAELKNKVTKRLQALDGVIEKTKFYPLTDAIELVKKLQLQNLMKH